MHVFQASINYFKLCAPISSHLQLFQAPGTHVESLATISSSKYIFRALCDYFKLYAPILSSNQSFESTYTYFEPLAIIASSMHLFQAMSDSLKLKALFQTICNFCTYFKPLQLFQAPSTILSHL